MKEPNMKLKVTSLAATFLLGLISSFCPAQEFSADVVYLATSKPDAPATGIPTRPDSKLYVSKDKIRLETHGFTDNALVVSRGDQTAFALFPARKAYQALGLGPSEYFRVENADNACPDWQKVATQKIVCEKVGREVVNGRLSVKYQNKGASESATAAVWIDSALKFVVKWEGADAGAQLQNVKEGQQAANLFAVPSGYKVLTPQKGSSKGFSQRTQ